MNSSNSLILLHARLTIYVFIVVFSAGASSAVINTKTVISDQSPAQALEGRHRFSLQWVSHERFGEVVVTNQGGTYRIQGRQMDSGQGEVNGARRSITIDGIIEEIGKDFFVLDGSIVIGNRQWRRHTRRLRPNYGALESSPVRSVSCSQASQCSPTNCCRCLKNRMVNGSIS